MDKKAFLLTGTGRSGTLFLAKTLNRSQKWEVKHESPYDHRYIDNHHDLAADELKDRFRETYYGEVNSQLRTIAPALNRRGVRVYFTVRHPMDIIKSVHTARGRSKDEFEDTLYEVLPSLTAIFLLKLIGFRYFKFEKFTTDKYYFLEMMNELGVDDLSISDVNLKEKINSNGPGSIDDCILPDALLNYLVRLGWSHGDQEIFSIQEMIKLFDLESVHKSAATFDNEKLLWVNQQHMKKTAGSSIEAMLGSYFKSKELHPDNNPTVTTLYDVQKERCKTLQEICDTSRYFYNDIDTYDEKTVKKNFTQDSVKVLRALKVKLTDLDSWSAERIHMVIKAVADDLDLKLGKVAPALRLAVTGQGVSPPIDVTLELLGSDKSLHRIDQAIDYVVGSV